MTRDPGRAADGRRRAAGRLLTMAAAFLLTLGIAACGNDDGDSAGGDTPAPTTTVTDPAPTDDDSTDDGTDGDGSSDDDAPADALAPRPLAETEKLTFAIPAQGVEAYAAMHLANYFGEFEAENLDVEITVLPSSDILVGMLSGQVHMTPSGYQANVLNAVADGADLAFVASLHVPPDDSKLGMWVRNGATDDDDAIGPCDFEGMTTSFGGPAGLAGTATWWVSEYLADCDLTVQDVVLSTTGGPDMLIGLQTGALDAAFLYDPLWADAEQEGYASLVIPQPRVALGGYLFGELRHDRPEVVEAVVRALVRTTRTYLQGDYHADAEVRAALAETVGIPEETLENALSLQFDPTMAIDPSPIVPMQDVWLGVGGILNYDEPIPADDLIDTSFLEAVGG